VKDETFSRVFIVLRKLGIVIQEPFLKTDKSFKTKNDNLRHKPKQIFKEVLRQEEINQIANAELPTKDLDRIRDIFLFTCYTGLAYSDVKQLKSEHIVLDNDHSLYIRKPRQKTGQESIIPLLPPALRILKKYTLTGNL
jgi:integrase